MAYNAENYKRVAAQFKHMTRGSHTAQSSALFCQDDFFAHAGSLERRRRTGHTGTGNKYITFLFCHDLHNNPPIIFQIPVYRAVPILHCHCGK